MPATYEPIATNTISGSSTSSVTFSSIPSTYTDLIVVAVATTSRGGNASVYLRFNSDTGTNYSTTFLYGNGSSVVSSRETSTTQIWFGQTNGLSSTNGIGQFAHIQNYANTTTYKTTLNRGGHSGQLVLTSVGLWRSTSAINSITLTSEGGFNFIAGNTFTLYGIKAA